MREPKALKSNMVGFARRRGVSMRKAVAVFGELEVRRQVGRLQA